MFDRIRTRFATTTKPHAPSTRLSLQSLESREVPANLYWLGYSTDFTDPVNWGGAIPSSANHLYFTGPTSPPPSPPPPGTPPPPPVPPSGSNTSTTFVKGPINPPIPYAPTSLPDNYAGVHILNGYSGTLTIPFNIEFGAYEQTSGNTYTPGTDVTVTSTFSWTGGNANTSSAAGVYHLQGQMGILGTTTSTVSSGSKLSIEPGTGGIGADLTVRGALNLLNDMGVEVMANCLVLLGSGQPGDTGPTVFGNNMFINQGQTYSSGGKLLGIGVLNDGGTLKVGTGGLKVTGTVFASAYSVKMNSGNIYIRNGQTLEATNGVRVLDGDLLSTAVNDGTTPQVATIDGALRFDDGRIILGTGDTPAYSTLKVKDTVKLYGGTFLPKVDAGSNQNRDAIDTNKTLDCTTTFTLAPQVLNGNAAVNAAWTVLVSVDGFVNNTDPSVSDPMNWKVARSGAGGKDLDVVKK